MVMHSMIRVGTIATGCDRLDVVVVLVFLLDLVVAQQQLGKHASWILSRLKLSVRVECNLILLALFAFKIGQETEFIECVVLIEIVELTWNLAAIAGNNGATYIAIIAKRNKYRLVSAISSRGIGYAHSNDTLSES